MADVMSFPNTFDEFAEQYKIVDEQEIYTNGTELIPIFRVKQWLEHTSNIENEVIKAKTNFDRIKAMSVEELAKMYVEAIMQLKGTAELLKNANAIQLEEFRKQLFIQAIRWLESEVWKDVNLQVSYRGG